LVRAGRDRFAGSGVTRRWTSSTTVKGDLIQLARYSRTLQAAGAVAGAPWGGALGAEWQVVWYRLDEVMWCHTDRSGVTLELSSLG
jgi:hypothetical protein